VIEEEGLCEKAEHLGKLMTERFQEMYEKYSVIGDFRGLGLMQVLEFVKDRKSKEEHPDFRDSVVKEAWKNGLLLLPCGSGVRCTPPLTIEEDVMLDALDILEKAIKTCSG